MRFLKNTFYRARINERPPPLARATHRPNSAIAGNKKSRPRAAFSLQLRTYALAEVSSFAAYQMNRPKAILFSRSAKLYTMFSVPALSVSPAM